MLRVIRKSKVGFASLLLVGVLIKPLRSRSRRILRAFRPEIGEELIRVLRPTIRSSTEHISVLRLVESHQR
jgi:hypothetical protein